MVELGLLCSMLMLDVALAGPTGARSKVVKEDHTEVPAADGSKSREILVQQSVEVTRMQLHTQSPEWAAPCWKNACKQVRLHHVLLHTAVTHQDCGCLHVALAGKHLQICATACNWPAYVKRTSSPLQDSEE
jgi:hypothetical protein